MNSNKNVVAVIGGLTILLLFTLIQSVIISKSEKTSDIDRLAAAQGSIQGTLQAPPAKPPFPIFKLDKHVKGEEAISILGDRLPEVAHWYGIEPEEFRTLLKKDKTLRLDKEARLYVVDENTVPSPADGVIENTGFNQSSLMPLEQTFSLHSRPGAPRVIYLDFNGHLLQYGKSAWTSTYGADIQAPPWDIDGNPTNFGQTEREAIQRIWQAVAEDWAPYNVDVTTEEPSLDKIERTSSSDAYFGNRVLFSNIQTQVNYPSAGGVSYIGIFNSVGEYYKTSLVFPVKLANGTKYMADAASHENGHSVGLSHQGKTDGTTYYSGQGIWGPIMGNSYYKALSQWSKGEYVGANNVTDELNRITSYGLEFITDDHGNTPSSASLATLSGLSISIGGFIERTGDMDYFKFNTDAVSTTLDLAVATYLPNLNAEITLYNSAGQIITKSSPTTSLGAKILTNLTSGTYYISVTGVGEGSPTESGFSNYASLGQYYLSGTIIPGNQPPNISISATPANGTAPLNVQFNSSISDPEGGVVTQEWDFGDTTTSTESNPTKTYNNPGTYNATIIARDSSNFISSKSLTITVTALIDPTLISAPISLTGSGNKGYTNLKWTDLSNNESGFYIERAVLIRKGTPIYQRVGTVGPNVTTFIETIPANSYYYRVQAFNSTTGKTSEFTNVVTVRIR